MKLDIHIVTEIVTLKIRILDDTVLLEIAERGHGLDLIRAGCHGLSMVVRETVAGDEALLPVDHRIVVRIEPVVLAVVVDISLRLKSGRTVVDECLVPEEHILFRCHIFRKDGRILPADIATVGY